MTARKQVSLHGRRAFVTPEDELVGRKAIATGDPDLPFIVLPGSDSTVAVFDDFLGDLIGDEWYIADGDTGKSATGVVVTGTNGFVRLTGSSTNVTAAGGPAPANVLGISTGTMKQWKANMGTSPKEGIVRMAARVRIANVTRTGDGILSGVFVGFADTGGAEMPFYDTGGSSDIAITTDGVGFLYSSSGDTGWAAVAVAADTVQGPTVVDTGVASNVWDTLEVAIARGINDTGMTAYFYVNGKLKTTINSPVTSSVALAPGVWFTQDDTGGESIVDVDYIAVSGPRDTGS